MGSLATASNSLIMDSNRLRPRVTGRPGRLLAMDSSRLRRRDMDKLPSRDMDKLRLRDTDSGPIMRRLLLHRGMQCRALR